jgi:hypothetical protein
MADPDNTPMPESEAPALILPEGPLVPAPVPTKPEDPWIGVVERAVRDPTVDIGKLEGLMKMRERLEDRRARQAFDNAIALAKGEIVPIIKNREVDFTSTKGRTNYRYEDFAAVARGVDPVLTRYGLSYRFRSEQQGTRLRVTCRLSHADGYSEETALEASNDESGNKNAIQSVGSAATYLQRYTLKLALGLAAATDADGAAIVDDPPVDADQRAYIEQLLRDTESSAPKFLEAIGADAIETLTVSQYKHGLELLAVKARRAKKAAAQTEQPAVPQ